MKKALLAVAILAAFGSASALAEFGPETEGNLPLTANVTMGGEISPPTSTWMTAIDAAPSDLNGKKTDFNSWRGATGNYSYVVSTAHTPLVKVHTKTTSPGGYPYPLVSIGNSDDVLAGPQTVTGIPVSMDPDGGSKFEQTKDVTMTIDMKAGWARAYTYEDDSISKWIPDHATFSTSEKFTSLAEAYVDDIITGGSWKSSDDSSLSWAGTVERMNATESYVKVSAEAVAGAVNVTMISTRDQRPTGTWQATLPVEVTYI
ncbi:hypothetical protein ETN89_20360 (plasmid) [Photobacterium damselae subsp. damselae]|uniref:hypothetical protein n=1 Tax=Photobacterium damselae TaxID=38293 RepID=UPI000A2FD103|nr:hypothetical protein [Photobacterium damselae]ARR51833.1 hypothetical protein CAY62_20705 [Photobacterium damselae subsp. damselae]QAY37592.1 hypothetical protein ETN89_20360 [Photobacterium damselae subsp. damselae]